MYTPLLYVCRIKDIVDWKLRCIHRGLPFIFEFFSCNIALSSFHSQLCLSGIILYQIYQLVLVTNISLKGVSIKNPFHKASLAFSSDIYGSTNYKFSTETCDVALKDSPSPCLVSFSLVAGAYPASSLPCLFQQRYLEFLL